MPNHTSIIREQTKTKKVIQQQKVSASHLTQAILCVRAASRQKLPTTCLRQQDPSKPGSQRRCILTWEFSPKALQIPLFQLDFCKPDLKM
ncbi:hypothetical protein I79_010837 [Cricetulus griseus]|uniref:Uncharacterized protein n=1 Tax=Cricetulus griseus TaxID=10029 RepID=G3HJJ0_CRIGR|nr:hypothetical protein I79_010837 [Cricetulus griseus]